MAETIKGINIKLSLDGKDLDNELKEINKDLKEQQRDLRAINTNLRYDSSNVELWRMKQAQLNEMLETTKKRLDMQNKADLFLFLGKPKAIKLVYGLKKPKYHYVGSDIAGIVMDIGKDVKGNQIGDPVFGDLSVQKFVGYGEFAVCNESSIYHKPNNISNEEAAGLPMSASASLEAINRVSPKLTDHILVYGASGAVGYTLSQILISKGYQVSLVASKKHHHYLSKLKPFQLLDYTDSNFKLKGNMYHVIFAVNGYQPLKTYMKALKPHGILAVIGGDFKQINEVIMKGLFYKLFKGKKALSIMSKSSPETLKEIKALVEKELLKPLIGKTYPLEEVKQAYLDFEKGIHIGKIIIEMPQKI